MVYIEGDHCRIGSLETAYSVVLLQYRDHCRIGSLEKWKGPVPERPLRSLPHRQLRKDAIGDERVVIRSLPHRQLRNSVPDITC